MRPRAIKDLAQLSDDDLFVEVATGLGLVLKNAEDHCADAEALTELGRHRGAAILRALAEEEAAKYLILLDAIRCPRLPPEPFTDQLGRFNDHLAKGLYAKCASIRPATVKEVREFIDSHRDEYYLDGPNDVDWIFRNDILQKREERLYVDYVETDDGRQWLAPDESTPFRASWAKHVAPCLRLARALHAFGLGTPDGLRILANRWRGIKIADDLKYMDVRKEVVRTLEELGAGGLTGNATQDDARLILDVWCFPLYSLTFKENKVSREGLRQRQQAWYPDL